MRMNQELRQLFDEDQDDLRVMPKDRIERDRARRLRVQEMIDREEVRSSLDYIHAAIIFQHGEQLEDWWKAYELSAKAVKLGFEPKWIPAVALDRWLLNQGKPLKYGNQVLPFCGIYRIPSIDPATTDEERAQWDIPTIEELYSFQNLRGFMKHDRLCSLGMEDFVVNVIRLERPPAHTPSFVGNLLGLAEDEDGVPVYENPYGWKWQRKEEGSFDLGWLLLPKVPVVAHAIAEEGKVAIEKAELANRFCIWVTFNESQTIYFRGREGIWSITGYDRNKIIKKALSLILI